MPSRLFNLSSLVLATACRAASIGPVTDLVISNAEVNLDGYARQAVVAGGTFPGPIVRGNKASITCLVQILVWCSYCIGIYRAIHLRSMLSTN